MGFLVKSSGSHKIEDGLARCAEHLTLVRGLILGVIAMVAVGSRLFSVVRYESVIHEFDPWFNFRATKYLVDNGWYKFLNWFDETAWYPLGRVVGGTVYPGIMVTSAVLHRLLNGALGLEIDIRDLCVFLAPAFSGLTALATYCFASEISGSAAGLLAAAFVAICPGYISRSVAGSYDNEGIAIFLLMATFAVWIRAVKRGSALYAVLTALIYYYMVSAWGGYVYIINMIPLHVFVLLLMGRFSAQLYTAYCTFYVIGTLASMTVPFVGFQPTYTSEHMSALGVFGLMQILAFLQVLRTLLDSQSLRRMALVVVAVVFAATGGALAGLASAGLIAPWTGRFYALWDTDYARKHIPIIASVSEHQPTTWASFFFDLHFLLLLFPAGLCHCFRARRDEHVFVILWSLTSAYFAGVMVRLILTLAPIACVASAVALSKLLDTYAPDPKPTRDTRPGFSLDSRLAVLVSMAVLSGLFVWHCTWVTSTAYSSPSIILATKDKNGGQRIVDDFREAYHWLRHNTPKEAKVLAWWDYGYQIAGMADRTTIVDNNTWNNTHIATVGKVLASSEEHAYATLRELAVDYILVLSGAVSGFSGDDMNKFLWMIRIAEGMYPQEVREADFFTANREYRVDSQASPAMKTSILYKLSYHRIAEILGPQAFDRVRYASLAGVDPKLTTLDEVYSTYNFIVRIYKIRPPDVLGRSHLQASAFRPT